MAATALPVVGAALPIALLAEYRDWLFAEGRDLELQDASSPEVLAGDWRRRAREGRALLDGHTGRLGIHGPFIGLSLHDRDPRVRALTAERLRQGLEFAAELGATQMVVHSPFVFFRANPFVPHPPGRRKAAEVAVVRATLEAVLPAAAATRCAIVVENIADLSPAPVRALVHAVASPWVRQSLDTGHAFITHRLGGPPPDQWVREAGPVLAHLHLQDTDGYGDRHWAPGDGALDWCALFAALGDVAPRPRLILELRQPHDLPRAAAWLAGRGLAR